MDFDQQSEMIIFGLILTTFELSSIFGGSWGSIENTVIVAIPIPRDTL